MIIGFPQDQEKNRGSSLRGGNTQNLEILTPEERTVTLRRQNPKPPASSGGFRGRCEVQVLNAGVSGAPKGFRPVNTLWYNLLEFWPTQPYQGASMIPGWVLRPPIATREGV